MTNHMNQYDQLMDHEEHRHLNTIQLAQPVTNIFRMLENQESFQEKFQISMAEEPSRWTTIITKDIQA